MVKFFHFYFKGKNETSAIIFFQDNRLTSLQLYKPKNFFFPSEIIVLKLKQKIPSQNEEQYEAN